MALGEAEGAGTNEDNHGWLGNPRGLGPGSESEGARQVCVVTGGGVCVCRAMRGKFQSPGVRGRGRLRVSAAGRAPAGRRIGSHHILLRLLLLLALRGGRVPGRRAARSPRPIGAWWARGLPLLPPPPRRMMGPAACFFAWGTGADGQRRGRGFACRASTGASDSARRGPFVVAADSCSPSNAR